MKKIWMPAIVALMLVSAVFSVTSCSSGTTGAQGPAGPAGLSISSASVNAGGHLIITMSNGQTIDAGSVVGPTGASTGSVGDSFAGVIALVEPKIVRIDCTVAGGLDSGSGTIIDARGYILTNAHVVAGATAIKVTLKDGTILAATTVAADTVQDMAIIKLTSTRTDFPVMTLGTMSDFTVGDEVVAGGFPLGTQLPGPATFSQGMVSAMRTYDNANWIQIDVPINPGNSGGCLFTQSGRMIGIPSAGIDPGQDFEMINLAIPINLITAYISANVPK
ncbi:Trypsin-like peptidase domain-containing protein [Dehalogenimonas formicexedens]|uniref:Trypsin-like peptidase domain-containing protein n=1 Tax=Dehalogenimonas formicexedens TaxID=1839801 RepID=A0A1P8F8P7_9CHLR|nr:trypsin-like peptidase domain-containing protein [Dehalogenimonas formicexedens]APV44851.1 Trypsin-like peptidase domain-containing protein [Dehalogenimonas formicexedens]